MLYEEAKKIAINLNNKVNACNEYEKAYHFYEKESDADGDNGIVVLKDNGKAITWVQFILNYSPEKSPKKMTFNQMQK